MFPNLFKFISPRITKKKTAMIFTYLEHNSFKHEHWKLFVKMLLKKFQRNKKMLGDTNYFIQFYNIYSKNEKENLFSSDHPGVPFFF